MAERYTKGLKHFQDPEKVELLADCPVFSTIFNLQLKLANERYDSFQRAYAAGMDYVREANDLLAEAGLLGKEVSLTGFDIKLPHISFDEAEQCEVLQTETIDASDSAFAENPPVQGEFYGLHPVPTLDLSDDEIADDLLDKDTDDDIDDLVATKYKVALHYRLRTQENIVLNNFSGDVFALGGVHSTNLSFLEDKQNIDTAKALNSLANATQTEAEATIRYSIEDLLSPNEGEHLFNPKRIRKIGKTIRDHENEYGIKMSFRDALLDLITARLGTYADAPFYINANHAFVYNGSDSPQQAVSHFMGSFQILGIAFTKEYTITDDEATPTNNEVVAIAVPGTSDGDDKLACLIPFTAINTLSPLSIQEQNK